MKTAIAILARAWALALFALAAMPAHAATPIALYQAFRGQVNFVGTEETMRSKKNNGNGNGKQACRLVKDGSDLTATLAGIPSGAKILSAQLYWAGSGRTPDYDVVFDGVKTSAPANRQYVADVGSGLVYFSGAADVTSQVAAKGNGDYTFNGLTIDNGDPWCSAQTVVGGFSLLVIYSHTSEPYRLLNLYEGFQYFQNSGITLTLNNFAIPDPLPDNVTGRIAHITWEGDPNLAGGGEDLLFNGYEMIDALNPSGNQFNSASNVTGDKSSYGIDFDAYTVKSPVIKPGQTTATTTYRSGQDLVLLGAEVAALPYIPVSDLSLAMSRGGSLQAGVPVTYTLTVTNGGPDTEIGPVTLVDTLPAGLKFVSASGSGWTCTNSAGSGGATIVTCTQKGPVLSQAVMTPVLLTAIPSGAGSLTNSATVSGVTRDQNQANNSASDTSTPVQSSAPFVFTTKACAAGDAIVAIADGSASKQCPQFFGPVTAGAATSIYATAVSTDTGGTIRATPLSTSSDSHITVQLALDCAPKSTLSASYAGAILACGAPQQVKLLLRANDPSAYLDTGAASSPAVAAFLYNDVGKLTLSLVYNNGTPAQASFVSRPVRVEFSSVVRDVDAYPDQNPASTAYAFAKAGEIFRLSVAAVTAANTYAPSFGLEATPPRVCVELVGPLSDPNDDPCKHSYGGPLFMQDFVPPDNAGKPSYGVLVAKTQWYEAGMLILRPSLDDYLGSGPVLPPASGTDTRRTIGRFYPDHFTTTVSRNFGCLPPMNCPAAPSDPNQQQNQVEGATYSGQPFQVTVTAYGLAHPDGKPSTLTLYQNPTGSNGIALSPVMAPNAANAPAPAGSFKPQPLQRNASQQLVAMVCHELSVSCDPGKAHTGSWMTPVAVYLRASAPELRGMLDSAKQPSGQPVTVSSIATSPTQWEDGLVVVDGRLLVGNLFGSELSRLPLALTAQYWGAAKQWQINTNDNDSVVGTGLKLANCTRAFLNCPAGLLPITAVSAAPTEGGPGVQLAQGLGRLSLQAPARGQTGSVDISVLSDPAANPAAATWLPSTSGRANFGLFKSPLIYLREVY